LATSIERSSRGTRNESTEGVNILDFTHVQSGPACPKLLAWFGADVIKIECLGVEYAPGTKNQTMYK
jgi:crotonobetainyl-CoA:carnitine CoA-transferase CaiB-like acyl-CoA transferase